MNRATKPAPPAVEPGPASRPSRQLTEWKTGDASPTLLLSECDQLALAACNSLFAPATTLSANKGISVTWKCSRTILGNKATTEDMEQALIVMRNKPI